MTSKDGYLMVEIAAMRNRGFELTLEALELSARLFKQSVKVKLRAPGLAANGQ